MEASLSLPHTHPQLDEAAKGRVANAMGPAGAKKQVSGSKFRKLVKTIFDQDPDMTKLTMKKAVSADGIVEWVSEDSVDTWSKSYAAERLDESRWQEQQKQQPPQSPPADAHGGGGASLRKDGRSWAATNPMHRGTASSSSLAASTPELEQAAMDELLQKNVVAMRKEFTENLGAMRKEFTESVGAMSKELKQMKRDMERDREQKACCGVM